MAKRLHKEVKVQRQWAIGMTIPMEFVRLLGLEVGDVVNVEYDFEANTMIVTKNDKASEASQLAKKNKK